MKKLFLIFLGAMLLVGNASGQGPNTTIVTIGGVKVIQTLPDDFNSTSKKYPFIIFYHGLGEGGTDPSIIYNSAQSGGPSYYVAHNLWPTSFLNPADGQQYKFIVLTPQGPAGQGVPWASMDQVADYAIANLRADVNRMYITGLSEGGQNVFVYSIGCCGVTPKYTPAAVVPMSMAGGKPDQAACNVTISKNIHVWGFGSPSDGLGINTQLWVQGNFGGNSCNCSGLTTVPGLGRFSSYVGGHCCWGQFYTPTYTENVGGVTMNMYNWMLQYSQGAPPPNIPPVANAGPNQTITLPTNIATLTGSGTDADGTITNYGWTQTGGTAATITSPTSATTTITGLTTAGVRTFQLMVTDNNGATGTASVTVTVNPVPAGIVSSAPWAPPPSANITKIGCGEYQTTYVHADSTVHAWLFSDHYFYGDFGLHGVVEDIGAQYNNIVLLSDGTAKIINKAIDGSAQVTSIPIDTFGRPFNYIQHVYGFWQSYLFIAHDSLYYLGLGNNLSYGSMGLGTGTPILTKPMPLGQPAGRKITKVVTFEQAAAGMPVILALCDNGTVWTYSYGSTVPTQVTGFTGPAIDIGGMTRAAYCIITASDILAWGPFASYFNGVTDGQATPKSILASYTAKGLQMPLKQVASSYNVIHFIDAKNDMYAQGDNSMGEIGNGIQMNPWATYKNGTSSGPFAWDFARGQIMTAPVQIPGKWYQVFSGSNISFNHAAQDIGAASGLDSNWYAWGRNKNDALGNGIRAGNDNAFACWGIQPAPTYVSPAAVGHVPDFTFAVNNTFAPLPNAGIDQYVSDTTSTTLNGLASSQPEGSISTYAWTALDGATVSSPATGATVVTGMHTGTNRFKLTVLSNTGLSRSDTMVVTVLTGNAPIVNAGNDQTIKTNTTTLTGTATPHAGSTIVSTTWSQISGPGTALISSPGLLSTPVNSLITGVYVFKLLAIDNNGLSGSDTVTIVVGSCGCLNFGLPTKFQ